VHISARLRLVFPVALVAALLPPAARAQEPYPIRPVEIIVPFAAGGATDLVARLLSDGLAQRLKQSFVAINRPGANTNTGTLAAVRSKPDGYTLLMASFGLAANPSLYRKLPFDPARDLAPIVLIANTPSILVINPSLPARDLPELIAYVKARPGELNYASYGVGSSPHLAAELFQALTGTKIVHVPYGGGGGPAALGVIGNSVQMLFPSVVTVLGMVQGGSLRAVAIGSERRLPLLPDVPTFRESGVDLLSGTWYGLLAPAGTPAPILARLAAAAQDMLRDSAIHAKLTEQGAEVAGLGPIDFAKFLKDETARLSAVIRNANIQLD
jgi:tripartite-type tricarboxylate transporter receptor subunit TctC